jgi:hypothetical protein
MSKKFSESHQLIWQHIDPSTSETLTQDSDQSMTSCVNISQYNRVTAIAFRIAGSGTIQECAMYAATAVTGTGLTQITATASGSTSCTGVVASDSFGSNATGLLGQRGAGMIVMEATASEIDATLADADFVTVLASFATGTDELGVLYILSEPRYGESGLTSSGNSI